MDVASLNSIILTEVRQLIEGDYSKVIHRDILFKRINELLSRMLTMEDVDMDKIEIGRAHV